MCEGTINFRLRLEDILKNRQTFCTVEVGCLASDDLHPRAFFAHIVIKAQSTVSGSRGACDPFQLHNFTLAAQRFTQELPSHHAACHIIGGDVRNECPSVSSPVDGEDWYASFVGFLH